MVVLNRLCAPVVTIVGLSGGGGGGGGGGVCVICRTLRFRPSSFRVSC